MRVTRIPGDFHDIGDRPCRVYLNEQPVDDWIVADDFRRVVETPDGARFGSVRIDMANSVEFDGIKTRPKPTGKHKRGR